MESLRTMSYWGARKGPDIFAAPTEPRPRGLGRGKRPNLTTSYPPYHQSKKLTPKRVDVRGPKASNDHLCQSNDDLAEILRLMQNKPPSPGISAEAERASRRASVLALGTARGLEQKSNAAVASVPLQERIHPPRVGQLKHENHRWFRGQETLFGKAVPIPIFWGEKVVLYVGSETCWIPVRLLEKIFDRPAFHFGAFSECFRQSSAKNPKDSVCFSCMLCLRKHFHRCLSRETWPILENLRNILERHFIRRNGFPIQLGPASTCVSQQFLIPSKTK